MSSQNLTLTRKAKEIIEKYHRLIKESEEKAKEIKQKIEELKKEIKEFKPRHVPMPDGEYECPYFELIDYEEPYCHKCDMFLYDDPELDEKCRGKIVVKNGKKYCPVFGCLGDALELHPQLKKMYDELEELEREYNYYNFYDYVHKQLENDVDEFLKLVSKHFKEDEEKVTRVVFNDEFRKLFEVNVERVRTEVKGTKYEIELAFYNDKLVAVLVSYHYIDYWGANAYYDPDCDLFNKNNIELLKKFEVWHHVQRELKELCRNLFDDKVLFSVDVDALSLVSRSKEAIEKLLEQHEMLFKLRELEPVNKLFNKLSWCDAIVVSDGEIAYPVKKSKYSENEFYYKKSWRMYKLSNYVLSGIYFRDLKRKECKVIRNNHRYIVFRVD